MSNEEIIDVEPVTLPQIEDEKSEAPVEPETYNITLEYTLLNGQTSTLQITMPSNQRFDFNEWFLTIMEQNNGWFPLSENDRVNQSSLARVRRIA